MPTCRRLLFVTFIHGIFSQFGDVLMACLNLLNVPIRRMFNESIHDHYGPIDDESVTICWAVVSCRVAVPYFDDVDVESKLDHFCVSMLLGGQASGTEFKAQKR
ncbi:unnamed protein product [Heligmosomoides polygyrus]|uniref:Secreted protein n=1 Tax=Heligmosomoides polygyrus TaxID=6339 RepID=A0A183GRQ2_HELPZ|nr:unnamed protein product [Heligmosomoides polygyrus]